MPLFIFVNFKLLGSHALLFYESLSNLKGDHYRLQVTFTLNLMLQIHQLPTYCIKYLSKNCILLVQLGNSSICNEKLTSISIRPTVGHR